MAKARTPFPLVAHASLRCSQDSHPSVLTGKDSALCERNLSCQFLSLDVWYAAPLHTDAVMQLTSALMFRADLLTS